ncbi:TonB-dependent receptor [Paucibacter sp. JuS9]|uniref:TonB-dependent receptor n=1 Tax=Paucibacter sp. JuS9 TaxID=3228748 RepID=UPI003757BE8E
MNIPQHRSLRPISAAIALLAFSCAVQAQQATPATPTPPAAAPKAELDTVVVTGIRSALQRANEIKRDAPQVLDVITSEDVGKLPDANVAEALQRVTGVQVTRVFGEGQSVSIRGLPLVRVEVDGRTLLGYSARLSPPENEQLGRNSGLDTVPSGLFGRLEVRKSPIAAQVEGGLSGSVNLVTPDPLDFRGRTILVRGAAEYSQDVGKVQPVFSALIADQFAGKTLGLLLAVDYTKRITSTQAFERNNFFDRTGATADLNADGKPDISGDRLQYEQFTVDRSRFGTTAEAQLKLSPELELKLEGIYSKLKTERHQDFLSWRYAGKAITNPVFDGNFIIAGNSLGALQQAGLNRAEPTESMLGALSAKWRPTSKLLIKPEISSSRGKLKQTIFQITIDSINANVPGAFDYRAGPVPSLDLGSFNANDAANYKIATNGVRTNLLLARMNEKVAKLDAEYTVDAGDFKSIGFGIRQRDLHATSNAFRSQVTPTLAEVKPYWTSTEPGKFLDGISVKFPRPFITTIADEDYIYARASGGQPLLPNSARDYDLKEKATALYLMADFEGTMGGMPYSANLGVRSIRTTFGVDTLLQGATLVPVHDDNKYTNTLPSANIVFNVTNDFLVRLSASKSMQQAGIAELAPSTFVNISNRTATGGNASLKPTLSNNLDASFELYGSRSALISGSIFKKDVSNVQADNTVLQTFVGFENLGAIPYTRPANVGSAKVKGFEFGVQRFFDFLPAPFNGFGVIANYTFSDGEGDGGIPLIGVSKHSYNLIGLYESGPFSARLAFNARDKAAFAFTQGRPDYINKRSQLDMQFGYEFSKTLAIQFNAQNLNPKKSATVEFSQMGPLALNSYALSERRFSLGFRAKF